ncbi:hypothetical protein GGD38_004694 [Chitinophagaceae bacterium OAS944]|nr:hypothetical protein [Chitinophagaceae bacterium OAS944]
MITTDRISFAKAPTIPMRRQAVQTGFYQSYLNYAI